MAVLRLALAGSAAGVLCYYRADTFLLFAACVSVYSFFNCAVGPIGDSIVVDMALENGLQFSSIRLGGTLAVSYTHLRHGGFLWDLWM